MGTAIERVYRVETIDGPRQISPAKYDSAGGGMAAMEIGNLIQGIVDPIFTWMGEKQKTEQVEQTTQAQQQQQIFGQIGQQQFQKTWVPIIVIIAVIAAMVLILVFSGKKKK